MSPTSLRHFRLLNLRGHMGKQLEQLLQQVTTPGVFSDNRGHKEKQLEQPLQQGTTLRQDIASSRPMQTKGCCKGNNYEQRFALDTFPAGCPGEAVPFHGTLSRHGKTRASSVLLMVYRKRCIMLFPLQQDCNTRAKRVGSISWYPFSPWQNSSELGFAHGLPKALFIVVKVVQVVFHYKQECAPKAKRPCCFPSAAGCYGFSWRLARRSATT